MFNIENQWLFPPHSLALLSANSGSKLRIAGSFCPQYSNWNNLLKEVSNLTELRLEFMDTRISEEFSSEDFELLCEYLNQDNDVILEDLKKNNVQFTNKHFINHKQFKKNEKSFRLIRIGEGWHKAQNWILFFEELGRYVHEKERINVFINYYNVDIPAALISFGVVDKYYKRVKSFNEENLLRKFSEDDEISVQYDDGHWYQAKVIGHYYEKNKDLLKLNPYLKIRLELSKNNIIDYALPFTNWRDKIRISGSYKKSVGRSNKIYLNDEISTILEDRYSKDLIDFLKITSFENVNLIGRGIAKKFNEILYNVQFSDNQGSYFLSDYLYLNIHNDYNYSNVNFITGPSHSINNKSSVSIFIGANSGLSFNNVKSFKNIYLTDRTKSNSYEDTMLLINNLTNESKLSNENKISQLKEMHEHFQRNNINIPKGVELYVF